MGKATDAAKAQLAKRKAIQEEESRQKRELRSLSKAASKRKKDGKDSRSNNFVPAIKKHPLLSKRGLFHYLKVKERKTVIADFYYDDEEAPTLDVEVEVLLRPGLENPKYLEVVICVDVDDGRAIYRGGINLDKPHSLILQCSTPYRGNLVLSLGVFKSPIDRVVLDGRFTDRYEDGWCRSGSCRIYLD